MEEIQLAAGSLNLIKKDLGLENDFDLSDEDPFAQLHDFLTKQVQYLLDHDFGRLLNAMYRIDISEQRVKEILNLAEPPEIASKLADAIILREKQKMITRLKYSV